MIWVFHVLGRHKHQLQTSVICIFAHQSYLRYIFYEIAKINYKIAYYNKPFPTLNVR